MKCGALRLTAGKLRGAICTCGMYLYGGPPPCEPIEILSKFNVSAMWRRERNWDPTVSEFVGHKLP
jgi:hypothetical protein